MTHATLEVIGLISGGKDSFFSLLHCLANNHRIIALANLCPAGSTDPSSESSDLNSYMYQTAGYGIVHLYADAVGLPLYCLEISGTAEDVGKDYQRVSNDSAHDHLQEERLCEEDDEAESLFRLLQKVLREHPSANAVCSGAILSTYQRTRIESVARRLDLIPLSYLWQYPSLPLASPGGLLDDMAAVGFDVRIVKVASGGLDETLLWQNLMDLKVRAKVAKSVKRFGGSVLGEGGEYETLVVDGPMPFWKKRIEVSDPEMWVSTGGGGEACLSFNRGGGRVTEKTSCADSYFKEKKLPSINLWDREFQILISILAAKGSPTNFNDVCESQSIQSHWEATPVIAKDDVILKVSNITSLSSGPGAQEQMTGINNYLLQILNENIGDNAADDIVFTTILLRSMSDFEAVNRTYSRLFKKPNPPARVTVACGDSLPTDIMVMVSFTILLATTPLPSEGLHVQSRSYWAPANIGPYSQGISIPTGQGTEASLVHIAGQIPLIPASMEVLQAENDKSESGELNDDFLIFRKRTCLALQHLWRIGRAMDTGSWTGAVAFITGRDDVRMKAREAWEAWKTVHSRELWDKKEVEDDDPDVWDTRYGGARSFAASEKAQRFLPDFLECPDTKDHAVPGFFAVQVDDLPRGCDIEWQSIGLSQHLGNFVSYIGIPSQGSNQDFRTKVGHSINEAQEIDGAHVTVYTPKPAPISDLHVQVVPCRALWGPNGVRLVAGVVLQKKL